MIDDKALEVASELVKDKAVDMMAPVVVDMSDDELLSEHVELPDSNHTEKGDEMAAIFEDERENEVERIDMDSIPIERINMGKLNRKRHSNMFLTGHEYAMKMKHLKKRRKKNKMAKKSRRRNR